MRAVEVTDARESRICQHTVCNDGAHGQIRKVRRQTRQVGNAPQEEGDAQERLRTEGQEPQAGDRDRPERGPAEGRKGPAPQVVAFAKEAIDRPQFGPNHVESHDRAGLCPAPHRYSNRETAMRDVSLSDEIAVNKNVIFRELDGETVLLRLDAGIYYGLDPVGTRIWALLNEGGSLRRVYDALRDEFDVDAAVLEQDLLRL